MVEGYCRKIRTCIESEALVDECVLLLGKEQSSLLLKVVNQTISRYFTLVLAVQFEPETSKGVNIWVLSWFRLGTGGLDVGLLQELRGSLLLFLL